MTHANRYLLDTEACVLWADEALPPKVQRVLLPSEQIYCTDVSAWETLIKRKYIRGGFSYRKFWFLVEAIGAIGLTITRNHLNRLAELPYFPQHADPFDRLIIAQALAENLVLVGGDEKFALYPGLKVLWD